MTYPTATEADIVFFAEHGWSHVEDAVVDNGCLRSWRKILTQHFRAEGTPGEGGHYPWKVYVNQFTGRVTIPDGS